MPGVSKTHKTVKVDFYKFPNIWNKLLRLSIRFKAKWLYKLVANKSMGVIYWHYPDGRIVRKEMRVQKDGSIA